MGSGCFKINVQVPALFRVCSRNLLAFHRAKVYVESSLRIDGQVPVQILRHFAQDHAAQFQSEEIIECVDDDCTLGSEMDLEGAAEDQGGFSQVHQLVASATATMLKWDERATWPREDGVVTAQMDAFGVDAGGLKQASMGQNPLDTPVAGDALARESGMSTEHFFAGNAVQGASSGTNVFGAASTHSPAAIRL